MLAAPTPARRSRRRPARAAPARTTGGRRTPDGEERQQPGDASTPCRSIDVVQRRWGHRPIGEIRRCQQSTEHGRHQQCRIRPPRHRHRPSEDRIGNHVGRQADGERHQDRRAGGNEKMAPRPRLQCVDRARTAGRGQLVDVDHAHTLVGNWSDVNQGDRQPIRTPPTARPSLHRRHRRTGRPPCRTRRGRRRRMPSGPGRAPIRRQPLAGHRERGGRRRREGPAGH